MKSRFIFLILMWGILTCGGTTAQDFSGIFAGMSRDYVDAPRLKAIFREDSIDVFPASDYSWRIATFPRLKFPQFVCEARNWGLESYSVDSSGSFNGMYYKVASLVFKREKYILIGNKRILLSSRFLSDTQDETWGYEYNNKKPARNTAYHVIFIYDPHDYVEQVPSIVEALKEIIGKNPQQPFALLNEGYFDFKGRDIPLEPMLSYLSDSIPVDYQVKQLVNNYLIDAVMAYRILYNRNIRAIAIDDPKLIEEEAEHYIRVTYDKSYTGISIDDVIDRINEKLETAKLFKLKRRVDSLTDVLIGFSSYGLATMERYLQEKNNIESIIQAVGTIHAPSFSNEVRDLKMGLSETVNKIYYLRRDSVMSFYLNSFLSENPTTIPIVFIGRVHAKGLIDRLPDSTGFSIYGSSTPGGRVKPEFSNILKFKDRPEYIKHILDNKDHLKSPVAPLAGEGPAYRKFLDDVVRKYHHEIKPASDIQEACNLNKTINDVEISVVKSRSDFPIPAEYKEIFTEAYAKIEVSMEGKSMVLLEENGAKFSLHDEASLSFFREVNLKTPESQAGSMMISNFVDPATNTRFYSVGIRGAGYDKAVYYLFREPAPGLLDRISIIDHNIQVFLYRLNSQPFCYNDYGKIYLH